MRDPKGPTTSLQVAGRHDKQIVLHLPLLPAYKFFFFFFWPISRFFLIQTHLRTVDKMLELLNPELLLSIQLCFDSPSDLRNLIAASPANLRTFQLFPQLVLTTILRNAIHPVAMPSALAILQVPLPDPGHASLHPRTLEPILDRYFTGKYDQLPQDRAGLARLERLHSRASFLVQDFATRAWRKIHTAPTTPQPQPELSTGSTFVYQDTIHRVADFHWGEQPTLLAEPETPPPLEAYIPTQDAPQLSSNERGRLFRAFLRFELYCKVFPGCAYYQEDDEPFITAQQQNDYFLGHLRDFEIEELVCVYLYYSTVLGDFLCQIEDNFVDETLNVARSLGSIDPPGSPRDHSNHSRATTPESIQSTGSTLSDDKEDTPPCEVTTPGHVPLVQANEYMDTTMLNMFCQDTRSYFYKHLSYIVSKGLEFVCDSLTAEKEARRKMILNNIPCGRVFFAEALEIAYRSPLASANNRDHDSHHANAKDEDDDPSHQNSAWARFHPPRGFTLFNIYGFQSLRARGWVFWDSDRLASKVFAYTLRLASHWMDDESDGFIDHADRETAEHRLEGVMLPRVERDRIRARYETTFFS